MATIPFLTNTSFSAAVTVGTTLTIGGDVISNGQISCNTDTTTPTSGHAVFYKSSAGTVLSGYQAILETGSAASRAIALTVDASQKATFASDVGLGGTGLYTALHSLNIDGTGLAIKNDTNGSNNNWSSIKNTASASSSNFTFTTGTGISLTLNHDTSATFAGIVSASTFLGNSTTQTAGNNTALIATTAFVTNAVAAAPQGDITAVVAGTGMSGGGTSGSVTLNNVSLPSFDTRSTNPVPNTTTNGVRFDFKSNSTNGLSDGGTYNGQMTWRSYSSTTDLSGGQPIQLAYTANGNLWKRIGSTTSWATWYQFYSTSDFAIADYLPLAGGTMSGTITMNNNRITSIEELRFNNGGNIGNQINTDVDTGTETVANVAIATYTAAFFDFVVKKGTSVRSGTVYACHDGTSVVFTETSTNDLGNTSDVTLSVDISGTNMRLLATVTSNDWSVKSLIRAI